MNIDTTGLVKLEDYYVIVKKYNGSYYYYGSVDATTRRWASSDKWKNARNAYLYTDKAEAQRVCDLENSTKKKLKLKVDTAANHFVSNFELYYEGWQDKIKVRNNMISIQDLKKKDRNINTSFNSENVKHVLEQIKDRKNRANNDLISNPQGLVTRLRDLQARYEQETRDITARYQADLEKHKATIASCDSATEYITANVISGTLVEEIKSKNDDKFKILYGKIEV